MKLSYYYSMRCYKICETIFRHKLAKCSAIDWVQNIAKQFQVGCWDSAGFMVAVIAFRTQRVVYLQTEGEKEHCVQIIQAQCWENPTFCNKNDPRQLSPSNAQATKWTIWVRIPSGVRDFSLLQYVRIISRVHPTSY